MTDSIETPDREAEEPRMLRLPVVEMAAEPAPPPVAAGYEPHPVGTGERIRFLERVKAELVEALREAIDIAWVEDSHAASFDSTVIFSPYYDFSSLDGIGRIEFLGKYDCIVWPARGVAGGKWSAYCTYEGSLWFEKFDTAADAKEACMCLLDKVLPDHPAMRARAALTSATKEQQK